MKLLCSCLLLLVGFASCKNGQQASTAISSTHTAVSSNSEATNDSLLLSLTKQVLQVVKGRRYKDLTPYIHPVSGIRFSPYAYIDTASDQQFTKASWPKALKSQAPLTWGSYDGSGDAITLTLPGYFRKFVYDVDFLNAEQVSVNKMIGGGNSLNNLEAAYPGCHFTESYFSGFDKKLEGMDWRTLRLVFKKLGNRYYLVGIVHDQWTI
jgi:hypothetical protein